MHRRFLSAVGLASGMAALILLGTVFFWPAVAEDSGQSTPQWIWADGQPSSNQTVYFRKEFSLRGRLSGARLYATADNHMAVFVNGKQVVKSDSWETPVFVDIKPQLKGGRNVIAVRAKNDAGPAGLLLQLDLATVAIEPFHVVSDASWQVHGERVKGWQTNSFDASDWDRAHVIAPAGKGPWQPITAKTLTAAVAQRKPTATPLSKLIVKKDFQIELIHTVPEDSQGSWVSMCVDPKGRLIASDQYGGLFRITPPGIAGVSETQVEAIDVPLGEAQGLLWAFDSLYVVVNRGRKYASGLYRVLDTDQDDRLDTVKLLRKLNGGGEHGPHAVLLAPDGQSLFVLAGNHTQPTEFTRSRVPQVWQEDQLLPRMWDAKGHARGRLAPGGWIAKVDPQGKTWELYSNGYRNEYDAAFNRAGDLFTYDADMEWDMNTPWYRPTRVCLATSGSEFGWRSGTGKWPDYYPDSLPAVVNIGPGSPTGVCFGYGTKFPHKYQDALYLCDWSYGKLYAVHLKPQGAGYTAEFEEFINGTPLPLTDIVINPVDGAMYFAIGGRRVTSGLYRVRYTGSEPTSPSKPTNTDNPLRALRRKLEAFHGRQDPGAVAAAWPYLGHEDRYLRFAARVAIEHQPASTWAERAVNETNPLASIEAMIALARVGEAKYQSKMLARLNAIDWNSLSFAHQLALLRAYGLTFARLGEPAAEQAKAVIARLDPLYPAKGRELNAELSKLLVYLQAPTAATKTIPLLEAALTQEEELDYVLALRNLKAGWTPELRQQYFRWFIKAGNYTGGASFGGFINNIKAEAVTLLDAGTKERLKPILEAKPDTKSVVVKPRPIVRQWTMEDLAPLLQKGLQQRDFDNGRQMFAAAQCYACHRYGNEGGASGPDLTGVAGRFSPKDLLESIIHPSKEISDQYAAVNVATFDGRFLSGRIVNLSGDGIMINTNMLDPNAIVNINRRKIEEMTTSKVSMMPKNLLDTLDEQEVLDLMAYLLSRNDRNSPMFQK